MNKKYEYEIGKVYGILKLERLFKNNENKTMAEVRCVNCNKLKIIRPNCLYNDKYNSCACKINKHGMSKSKIYSVYHNMKDRCYNNKHHEFHNYGGKGVKVCDEWLGENGFKNFLEWANNNGYEEGLSIDRIKSEGNYEPSNCQWITKNDNTIKANKTCQHRKANKGKYYGIDPYGVRYEFDNASEFAKEHNLNPGCIRKVANEHANTHKKWRFGFISEEGRCK